MAKTPPTFTTVPPPNLKTPKDQTKMDRSPDRLVDRPGQSGIKPGKIK